MSANEPTAGAACAAGCPRHALGARLLTVAGWLVAALAALSVAALPLDDAGDALCGAWGCLPPLPALVALHLFWFVAAGALVHATARLPGAARRVVGSMCVGTALAAAALVIGTDLYAWFAERSEVARAVWPQRVAFRLATATDVPAFQLLCAGVASLAAARRETLQREPT